MSLVEFNWEPSNRQLRQFGVVSLFALPLIGWLWSASPRTVGILAIVGLVIAVLGWIQPKLIKPVFLGLAIVATPIGMVLSEIMVLLIYGLVFVPMALCFRLVGRDSLQRKGGKKESYWEPVKQPKNVASYYRQS